jgi:hypothetical protein
MKKTMAVYLNAAAFQHAKDLIERDRFVDDERDEWSEHQPTAAKENVYIEHHGFADYGLWYLGLDDDYDEDRKGRYKFPYGDFENVHRCGLLSAESRAGQYKHVDIEGAAATLLATIKQRSAIKK